MARDECQLTKGAEWTKLSRRTLMDVGQNGNKRKTKQQKMSNGTVTNVEQNDDDH